MSRRLQERHRSLREAEVFLEDVPRAGSFRVALVWPNLYFVGMSNLGFQAVYRLLNRTPDVVCERAFLPDDEDKAELERTGSPLVSFETGTPLRDFDAVAFSISFENDYLHVLQVLRLAGIPLRAKDRGPRDPVVILGGAAMFLNPEPLAPFADLVAVGEGEPMVPRMMEALLGAADPRKGLEALQPKDGFYVPSRYEVRYHADGTVAAYDGPGRVTRQRGWPGAMGFPQSVILTPHTEMSMKYMVEISRGCPCMCRFCWAGYNYLPVRGFTRSELVARAREVRAVARKIGLVSTAVCDHPEIDGIVDDLAAMDYEVSVASLRLDDLTPQFVFKLADTGVQGLTLAPECGSDRMRRILNKQFTNAEILDKATWIFENGIQNLKLYYMVGPALRGARGRRGDRRPHRPDPRADARGRARPRPDRAHPPVGEPLRAEAGDALPVAAHGGPEGDRPQAPVPAEGLRPDAERGRGHQERADGRRAVGARPRRPARGGRPRAPGDAGARPQARARARRASTRPSTSSAAGRRTRSCPGTSSTTGSARTTSGRSSSSSRAGAALAALPRDPGLHPLRRLRRDAEPLLPLPEKWKGRETRPSTGGQPTPAEAAPGPPGSATPGGCASSARRRPSPPRPSSTRRRGRRPRRCRPRRGRAAPPRRRRARSPGVSTPRRCMKPKGS